MKKTLTAKRLKALLHYNPETGKFKRIANKGGDASFKEAGGLRDDGYVRIGIGGKAYLAHRLAWLYMTGNWPAECIDHINRVKSDNRFENLREATKSQNAQNTKLSFVNKSGFKGVSRYTYNGKWFASITAAGKKYELGSFDSAEAASAAYCDAARKLHANYTGETHAKDNVARELGRSDGNAPDGN